MIYFTRGADKSVVIILIYTLGDFYLLLTLLTSRDPVSALDGARGFGAGEELEL